MLAKQTIWYSELLFSTNEYVNVTKDTLDNVTDVACDNMEEYAKCENKINVILDDVSLEKSKFN